MKAGRAAFLNCLAIKSVTRALLEAVTAGAGERGGAGREGRLAAARSPRGLPGGAIWDVSEGHWDRILVSWCETGSSLCKASPDPVGAQGRALPAWDAFPHSKGAPVSSQSS